MLLPRRLFMPFLGLVSWHLGAQSYETSFSNVTFDRARTPATLAGVVQIDSPSGAASIDIPMGPGIGRGDLHYTPRLTGRFAPTMWGTWSEVVVSDPPPNRWPDGWMSCMVYMAQFAAVHNTYLMTSCGGATLSPGYFDLVSNNAGARGVTHYLLPDGSTGTLGGLPPQEVLRDGARSILNDFHYPASTQVANMPAPEGRYPDAPPLIQTSSGKDLILGLYDPAYPLIHAVDGRSDNGSVIQSILPGRMLVVRGNLAVEYAYASPEQALLYFNYTPKKSSLLLRHGHYKISRIINRFGEALEFNHAPDGVPNGVDFDVTWTLNGKPVASDARITVRLQALPVAAPSVIPPLMVPRSKDPQQKGTIRIQYEGAAFQAASSYRLEAIQSDGGSLRTLAPTHPSQAFELNLQPLTLTQESDGQSISFGYTVLGSSHEENPAMQITEPQTGALVPIPVTVLSEVDLPGRAVSLTWRPYPFRMNGFDAPGTGNLFQPGSPVNLPQFFFGVSLVDDGGRVTRHDRVVPTPDFSSSSTGGWAATAFFDAITHPDGSVTVHRFASPVPGSSTVGSTNSLQEQIQTLAFLKHLTVESRHYPQGTVVDAATGSSSTAPMAIEQHDRLDLRSPGNPTGGLEWGSLPVATRTQVKDLDTGVLQWNEVKAWDASNLDWPGQLSRAYTMDLMPFEWTRSSGSDRDTAPASSFNQDVVRTLASDWIHWWPGRVKVQERTGQPLSTFSYNPDGTLDQVQTGGDEAAVRTRFGYKRGRPLLDSVTLIGKDASGDLALSGSVGIASYGYDGFGFLSEVLPLGAKGSEKQTCDGFGRPVSRTDANQFTRTFSWDGAGRLVSLGLPNGEAESAAIYPPEDPLLATFTRGTDQWSQNRFNGFGEVVLTRRRAGGKLSHKRFDYDGMGRKVAESVWLDGAGSESESIAQPRTSWTYDAHGRLAQVQDPDGVLTRHAYNGLTRTVEVAPGTGSARSTLFTSDPLGRLIQVANASDTERTRYTYDAAGRILQVVQSGDGHEQVRTWAYDHPLKWLTSLTQPESGTTTYSRFDVTGRPWTASYQGRVVDSEFDALGRLRKCSARDGSVDVAFGYDEAGHGAALGRLTSDRSGSVERQFTYGGLNGRLSSLSTTVPGAPAFLQEFHYDGYGFRDRASLGGLPVDTPFDPAKGQPSALSVNGSKVVEAEYDDASWLPRQVRWTNGVTTFLVYDPGQLRLNTLMHSFKDPSGALASLSWGYKYDPRGLLADDGENRYEYDLQDRLVKATLHGTDPLSGPFSLQQSFGYDAFGNLTRIQNLDLQGSTSNRLKGSFALNASDPAIWMNNRLPSDSATGAHYDAQGNLDQINMTVGGARGDVRLLTYDALGRVSSMTDSSTGLSERYTYTAEGLRTLIEEWMGGALQRIRVNLYDDARKLVSQWVME